MFELIAWDGQPISTPGIYTGIPLEVYHGAITVEPSIVDFHPEVTRDFHRELTRL